jgi:hypothetical protein
VKVGEKISEEFAENWWVAASIRAFSFVVFTLHIMGW